jgi:hypothetical protein
VGRGRGEAGYGGEAVKKVGIILEKSGVVRDAFLRRGHDAVSCDLEDTRSPGPHRKGDVFTFDWAGFDLLIMHPECTYLASSGLHWNKRVEGRAQKTEEALEFVARLWRLPCGKKALENPIGCLSTRWRKPDQIIQPWQFGDDASKATCLWLEGLPLLRHTNVLPGGAKARRANQTTNGQNKLGPSPMRKELRSNTYAGIANAMAEQWGGL